MFSLILGCILTGYALGVVVCLGIAGANRRAERTANRAAHRKD